MGGGASGGVFGIPLSEKVQVTPKGWWAALPVGGKLYCIPCSAERMLIYDPAAGEVCTVDTRIAATGEGKWRAAVSLNGRIYGIPDRSDSLLVMELATGRVSGVPVGSVSKGTIKWQSAAVLGGKVYGVPFHAEKILVYDPAARKASGISTGIVASGPSKWFAGAALGGRLYGVPCNAPSILIYDPVSRSVTGTDVSQIAAGPFKWLAAVSCKGKLLGIPCHADCLLVYDVSTGEVSSVDTSSIATGPGKWTSGVVLHGKVYGVPDNADQILVYDPETNIVSGVDISHIAQGPGKWQSAVTAMDKIYAIPHNAEQVLVYDPATNEAVGIDTRTIADGPKKWGSSVLINGRVCGVPYDAKQLLVHEPLVKSDQTEKSLDFPGDISAELQEDLVAAWLSEWIYWVSDASMPPQVLPVTVGGVPVHFHVQAVHEEPMQGSPTRLATVVAEIPRKPRVMYLIFKGSSFVTDLVTNASISPDFVPFTQAFGDKTTFVHHGAYHAIAQLRVHEWELLIEQLKAAANTGVEHLVVTGHSLGGQYAHAFLLEIFLEMKQASDSELPALLKTMRVVTFGTPMTFGAAEGCEVRNDLACFIKERSVNYMTLGDPAPRLWSELDIDSFMEYLAGWIDGKLTRFSSWIVDKALGPGGLRKRAEEFLDRKDVKSQFLAVAALYSHICKIRILAPTFSPWRPLVRDAIKIEDHSLWEAYIPLLRDAVDPASAMSLFSETGELIT